MTANAPARLQIRWAAIGAAVAITLGAGGIGITQATTSSGERAIYQPIAPCRLADLRPAPFTVGPRSTPLGAEETITLAGWGTVGGCVLPTGTAGLALNVTAVGPTAATFLRLWPADGDEPETSNLNPTPGQPPTPNAVNVGLSAAGEFKVFNRYGSVSVIVDVVGVYDDHDHDDRYYTKSQSNTRYYAKSEIDASRTITRYYSPSGMIWIGASTTHTLNGCPTQPADASSNGTIVLDGIPVGATVLSATAYVYDSTTAPTYNLFWRIARLANGLESEVIDSLLGAGDTKSGLESHLLAPSGPLVLGVGDSMLLNFSAGGVAQNGFCGIGITYQLPKL